jgi:AcrR family transcriptional regulator
MSRRDEIIDALSEIINSQGLNTNFTIGELAKKVDIGKSTIYEYFNTKDELIRETMFKLLSSSMQQINKRSINLTSGFKENLINEITFVFDLVCQGSHIFKFLTPEFKETIPDSLREQIMKKFLETTKQYEKLFKQIIEQGINEGYLNSDNLEMKNILFNSLLSGAITYVSKGIHGMVKKVDIEDFIQNLYDTILKIYK